MGDLKVVVKGNWVVMVGLRELGTVGGVGRRGCRSEEGGAVTRPYRGWAAVCLMPLLIRTR